MKKEIIAERPSGGAPSAASESTENASSASPHTACCASSDSDILDWLDKFMSSNIPFDFRSRLTDEGDSLDALAVVGHPKGMYQMLISRDASGKVFRNMMKSVMADLGQNEADNPEVQRNLLSPQVTSGLVRRHSEWLHSNQSTSGNGEV